MIINTLVVLKLVTLASPAERQDAVTHELCRESGFDVAVANQPRPDEENDFTLRYPGRDEATMRRVRRAIVFEGHRIRVSVKANIQTKMELRPMKLQVLLNNAEASLLDVEWIPSRFSPDSGIASANIGLDLPPLAAGSYELTALPVGCSNPHHRYEYVRLEVRPVRTDVDRAAILVAEAKPLVFEQRQCDFADPLLDQIERFTTNFKSTVLAMRATCAEHRGQIDQALSFYEALQLEFEEHARREVRRPGDEEKDRNPGYMSQIERLRRHLESSRRRVSEGH